MKRGARLYQAIVDRSEELSVEFDDAATRCGFNPTTLLSCFDAHPTAKPHELHEVMKREQVCVIAEFLDCAPIRVLFLADAFAPEDIERIARIRAMSSGSGQVTRSKALAYLSTVAESDLMDSPAPLMDELVATTMSRNLREACQKLNLPFRKVSAWRNGSATAELSDLPIIDAIAEAIGVGRTAVMASPLSPKSSKMRGIPCISGDRLSQASGGQNAAPLVKAGQGTTPRNTAENSK